MVVLEAAVRGTGGDGAFLVVRLGSRIANRLRGGSKTSASPVSKELARITGL